MLSLGLKLPESLRVARAIGRAQVVLLSSHFERYIRSINEEAVGALNQRGIASQSFPSKLRLLHSKQAIDTLGETVWDNRENQLVDFVNQDAWLWRGNDRGTIIHDRVLVWMKSPKPQSIVRYFRYWEIEDIFEAITRKQNTKARLRLGIQALVDLRNNIAHGDISAQATLADIRSYVSQTSNFLRTSRPGACKADLSHI